MNNLVQYTGGSDVLTMAAAILALVALVINIVTCLIKIKRNEAIVNTQKIEYAVTIICSIIIAMVVGGILGYYYCLSLTV